MCRSCFYSRRASADTNDQVRFSESPVRQLFTVVLKVVKSGRLCRCCAPFAYNAFSGRYDKPVERNFLASRRSYAIRDCHRIVVTLEYAIRICRLSPDQPHCISCSVSIFCLPSLQYIAENEQIVGFHCRSPHFRNKPRKLIIMCVHITDAN